MDYTLPATNLIKIKEEKTEENAGRFIIEPLSPGYGVTLGNSLRRVLLSSLQGSAISEIKIEGTAHEFTTVPGMKEDVVELILNLKGLMVKLHGEGPEKITLEKKGPGKVLAKDFTKSAAIEIIDPEYYLASLDKEGKLKLEVTVSKGRGYSPTETREKEKVPLGTILVDAIYSPVKKVHFAVENTRVGGATNFDKLTLEITTDGTVTPRQALSQSAKILVEHFGLVVTEEKETPAKKETKPKKALAKTKSSKTKVKK